MLALKLLGEQIRKSNRWVDAYIFRLGLALQVWLNRLVLLVELREVWYEILDDVGMWERINPGFVCCICRNSTCSAKISVSLSNQAILSSVTYTNKPAY